MDSLGLDSLGMPPRYLRASPGSRAKAQGNLFAGAAAENGGGGGDDDAAKRRRKELEAAVADRVWNQPSRCL